MLSDWVHHMTRLVVFSICFGVFLQNVGGAQERKSTLGGASSHIHGEPELVGPGVGDAPSLTPVNQVLTPYGQQLDLPGMRPQALALSPDGALLAVSGKTNQLVIVDPQTLSVVQRVNMPGEAVRLESDNNDNNTAKDVNADADVDIDARAQVSYTGLIFSPDGRQIYLSNVNGSVKVFAVDELGQVTPSHTLALPNANAPRRTDEIPSGLAISEDGGRLYVCGNLSNQLFELDTKTGEVTHTWPVGVAPYDVVLVANKAFVSNWGGRRPGTGDLTGPAGRGTEVRVDPVRFIANEGSVSIVTLNEPTAETNEPQTAVRELLTGLHASGLAVSPDGKYVVCANATADTLSVIDVAEERVVQTIWAKAKPSDLFGAAPNALVFAPAGDELFVANGSQNAIAVIEFRPEQQSELEGLIPVGWYPGALCYDRAREQLLVANIKGLPVTPKTEPQTGAAGFNSHHYHGSLSMFGIPNEEDLLKISERAARNMRAERIAQTALPARPDQPPRAIPQRIGEPSLIEHVVYVIKENRTYDQVLGDIERANGNAELCIFGREITPNQHKMVDEFVLLDNTYCAGILSADGHQWSTTAISTDYMEKSFAGFPRSYPDGMGIDENDALAYSPAGFIWDNAVAHGKSIRNYGEFMMPTVRYRDPQRKGSPDYLACYRTWKGDSDEVIFECQPSVDSLTSFSPTGYVGWEMAVPDQYRADFIIEELKQFEQQGKFPQLTIICLPNDHASGTRPGSPTPASCLADNDLAFGRIVEALSHSKFWPRMAILGIEDDPQAGWDHVSGYRTTAYCISPYARRGTLVSTHYNTTSVLRTIEQILGLPPMNQFDASAVPMFDCFVDTADLTPFDALATNIPLDQMNPDPKAISDPELRSDALVSLELNFREVDRAPEDVLNRILWRAMKGTAIAYPEWATGIDDDDD
ncbi:MAG: alkaline phosphatase family protein [Pirellulaceae bacterium]